MIKKFCGLLMLIGISVGILSGCSSSKIEKHSIRMVEGKRTIKYRIETSVL